MSQRHPFPDDARLGCVPGDGPPAPHPGRDSWDSLLAGDTPGRAEQDRRTVEAWGRARGVTDEVIAQHAGRARAKLLAGKE